MASPISTDMEPEGQGHFRPSFVIGHHDGNRRDTLNDAEYGHVLNTGVS